MWRIWGLSLEGQSPYSWEAALIPRIDRLYRIWGLSPRGQTPDSYSHTKTNIAHKNLFAYKTRPPHMNVQSLIF